MISKSSPLPRVWLLCAMQAFVRTGCSAPHFLHGHISPRSVGSQQLRSITLSLYGAKPAQGLQFVQAESVPTVCPCLALKWHLIWRRSPSRADCR